MKVMATRISKSKNFASVAHFLYIFFAVTVWLWLELKLPNFKWWECKQYIYHKFSFVSLNLDIFERQTLRKFACVLQSEQVGIIILMFQRTWSLLFLRWCFSHCCHSGILNFLLSLKFWLQVYEFDCDKIKPFQLYLSLFALLLKQEKESVIRMSKAYGSGLEK